MGYLVKANGDTIHCEIEDKEYDCFYFSGIGNLEDIMSKKAKDKYTFYEDVMDSDVVYQLDQDLYRIACSDIVSIHVNGKDYDRLYNMFCPFGLRVKSSDHLMLNRVTVYPMTQHPKYREQMADYETNALSKYHLDTERPATTSIEVKDVFLISTTDNSKKREVLSEANFDTQIRKYVGECDYFQKKKKLRYSNIKLIIDLYDLKCN